jgi:hypothetical protein
VRFRLCVLAALAVPLLAPADVRAADDVPPPGTVLIGTLDHGFDSRSSDVLEPFTITGVASDDQSYRGGRIFGHVTRVVKASKNTRAEIDFVFDAYITPAGRRYPMQGQAVDLRVATKKDAPPVSLGVIGTGVVAMKPRTDVTIPPRTMIELQVTQ